MTLWQWFVGLFRKKSGNPAVNDDAHFHHRERQRVLGEKAADATRTAEARLPPHQGGINFLDYPGISAAQCVALST